VYRLHGAGLASRSWESSVRDRLGGARAVAFLSVLGLLAACGSATPTPTASALLVPSTPSATSMPSDAAAPSEPPASTPVPRCPSPASTAQVDRRDLTGRIAFSFDTGIWTSDASGSRRHQVTTDGGFDPTWSPNGRQIVYRRLLADDDGEIWVVSPTGSGRTDLVNDPAHSDWGPAWSPDGAEIAFDSDRVGGLALWLMDGTGTRQRILTRGHGEYPAWSPDGTEIAYAGGTYYDIRVINRDRTGDHAIVTGPAYDMGPAWSPDGDWIAYHTQADAFPDVAEAGQGPEMEIHLVHPDGSADHRITCDDVEDSFPTWSPDGRFLIWSRHGELVAARPDGSGMIELGPGNFPSWIRS
jgi:TolB protein